MLPGERPAGVHNEVLSRFLRQEAAKIARLATKMAMARLEVSGLGTKRNLRASFLEHIEEAARLLELYGDGAPPLFGEGQRRHAALRLSQGAQLEQVIEENAMLTSAILEVWGKRFGPLPIPIARRMTRIFEESAAQLADVFLTFQRSEAAAFREAALLQTLVSNLTEAIFLIERDGVISYVSPVLEKITSYPAQLFIGESILGEWPIPQEIGFRDKDGNPVPPEKVPAKRALETGTRQHMDAAFIRRADGTDGVFEIDAVPIFDEDEQLRGVVVTARDRTNSFRKQQELEAAYRELRQLHARLLTRTRLEAVGGLAQSAAHALNNQLNVIALRLKKLETVSAAAKEVEGIERSVREIAKVVEQLQELASAPSYRKPVPTDLNSVIDDSLNLTKSEIEAAGLEIRFKREETPLVVGERETLLEFIAALLLGHIEVLDEGEVIVIETRSEGEDVAARITDTGPPLSKQEIDALFEPLSAGSATRVLSLSAGRHAVEGWGGTVSLAPREGGGNVWEIRLPIAKAEPVEAPREPPAPTPAPTEEARTVLVVDDDPDNAEMLAALAEDAGAVAHTALTGEEGLALAERVRPDVALVDLLLPDMDGWDVAKRLKEKHPGIRLAVVSGLAVTKEEEGEEADEVFRKPVDAEELLRFLGFSGA